MLKFQKLRNSKGSSVLHTLYNLRKLSCFHYHPNVRFLKHSLSRQYSEQQTHNDSCPCLFELRLKLYMPISSFSSSLPSLLTYLSRTLTFLLPGGECHQFSFGQDRDQDTLFLIGLSGSAMLQNSQRDVHVDVLAVAPLTFSVHNLHSYVGVLVSSLCLIAKVQTITKYV